MDRARELYEKVKGSIPRITEEHQIPRKGRREVLKDIGRVGVPVLAGYAGGRLQDSEGQNFGPDERQKMEDALEDQLAFHDEVVEDWNIFRNPGALRNPDGTTSYYSDELRVLIDLEEEYDEPGNNISFSWGDSSFRLDQSYERVGDMMKDVAAEYLEAVNHVSGDDSDEVPNLHLGLNTTDESVDHYYAEIEPDTDPDSLLQEDFSFSLAESYGR